MSPGASSGVRLCEQLVDGLAGLHEHDDLARPRERGDERFERHGADELLAGTATREELRDLGARAVVHAHAKAFALHVQGQVLAHYGEADQTDVALRLVHRCFSFGSCR